MKIGRRKLREKGEISKEKEKEKAKEIKEVMWCRG